MVARYFDPDAVAGGEVIAGGHGLERDLIYFTGFQPGQRLVVSVAIAEALDGLIEVVSRAVGVDVDQLHCEVGIFGIGRNMKRDADRTARLDGLLDGFGSVDQDVGTGFLFALIESAAGDGVARAADVAAIAGHGVHGIVREGVGLVGGGRRGRERAIAAQAVGLAAARKVERHGLGAGGRPRIGGLPLVDPHGEVANARHLLQDSVVFALQEMVEPAIGELVVIQAGIAHAALAHHRVFGGALVADRKSVV